MQINSFFNTQPPEVSDFHILFTFSPTHQPCLWQTWSRVCSRHCTVITGQLVEHIKYIKRLDHPPCLINPTCVRHLATVDNQEFLKEEISFEHSMSLLKLSPHQWYVSLVPYMWAHCALQCTYIHVNKEAICQCTSRWKVDRFSSSSISRRYISSQFHVRSVPANKRSGWYFCVLDSTLIPLYNISSLISTNFLLWLGHVSRGSALVPLCCVACKLGPFLSLHELLSHHWTFFGRLWGGGSPF